MISCHGGGGAQLWDRTEWGGLRHRDSQVCSSRLHFHLVNRSELKSGEKILAGESSAQSVCYIQVAFFWLNISLSLPFLISN